MAKRRIHCEIDTFLAIRSESESQKDKNKKFQHLNPEVKPEPLYCVQNQIRLRAKSGPVKLKKFSSRLLRTVT